jgi:hypothetical protein
MHGINSFLLWALLAVLFTVIGVVLTSYIWSTRGTLPVVSEGFAGPAKGAGAPDCIRSSSDAAALYELLHSRTSTTEEGPDDLREITVLLSKLSCFKKDLTGGGGVIEATRYQPFSTAHDIEPIAETTARCFASTIPQRDLQIAFDKWGTRGTFLIKRLCTSENLSEHEEKEAIRLFGATMADVADIAMGRCCTAGKAIIAGMPLTKRSPNGLEGPNLLNLGPYDGYY